ncbi:MAG: DNA repair protein RecN [Candidatus Izemoplasmatales bacterium]|nr:DNA repair protein RecN [Candidatus Izemoplasmatales bacterium]
MLKRLNIRDFAIIDDLTIDFEDRLTVLTGETGAGKSILIDAISLLLGDRASQEMIRSGKEKAVVEALFTNLSDVVMAQLKPLGIDALTEELWISREISTNNKNLIKMNQVSVTLSDLRELTKHLADVHSQFDTQRLIHPQNYLALMDGFAPSKIEVALQLYQSHLHAFLHAKQEHLALLRKKRELEERQEMYQYQFKELQSYELNPKIIDEWIEQEKLMSNFDKIYSLLASTNEMLEEGPFMDIFYNLSTNLSQLSEYQKEFESAKAEVEDAYYRVEDIQKVLSRALDRFSYDPEELAVLQEKIHDIETLQKKYHMDVLGLAQHRDFLEKELDQTFHYEEYLEKTKNALYKAFEDTLGSAKALTALRQQIAKRIEKDLAGVFVDLVLPNTKLEIVVSEALPPDPESTTNFSEDGVNSIEFMISTNRGEPLKPLSKTASGGEMSRIMLAFKTIFIRSQDLSTIVFDEIDTGISGSVAKQIARKIRDISRYVQVISITHIPQVVAIGDHHLHVVKEVIRDRTVARARYLNHEERIHEIAQMISGEKITPSALESAKSLLLEDK